MLTLAGSTPSAHAVPPAGSASDQPAASASASASAAGSASADASASASASAVTPQSTLPPWSDRTNTCVSCHATLPDNKLRAPAKAYLGSVHRDERVGCVGCHKGDPRDPTVEAHKAQGFIAHPRHAEIPGICGGCHGDAAFMRHLNARLPVGQAALYNISLHGKLSAAGDENAPTCADCHGQHEVLPTASPKAPVNRANVSKLCGGCHSDPKRMVKYDLRTDQVAKWEKSVHGQAFAKGNPNAPTCNGCHGAHSATPPDASSVARACGRCHEEEMGYFEQSPHSKGFRQRGLAECVACHGNHDVAPATSMLVGTSPEATCTKCHKEKTEEKPLKVATEIAALLRGARSRATEARALLAGARDAGLHVAGASFALDQLATAENKLRGVVHTLDPSRLEGPVATVDRAVAELQRLVRDSESTRKNERRGYFLALGLASALFLSLVLKAIDLDRRRKQSAP